MKCVCQPSGDSIVLCDLHARELRRRMAVASAKIEAQRLLLHEALDALIWCSGADDFQPGRGKMIPWPSAATPPGKARDGWLIGPAVTILKLKEALK